MDVPYMESPVPTALAPVVSRLWMLRMPSRQRFERIVPIPAVHLIVNLADQPYRVIARGRHPVGDTFPGAFISGVQLDYLLNENPPQLHHVGAALHPWALRGLGVDPARVAQRVVDARDLLPGIENVTTLDGLTEYLETRAVPEWSPDRRVADAVESLVRSPERQVAVLASDAGLTPKGFIAAFRRATGVTPKRFASVCRLQAFLADLPAEGELPTWTQLLETGRFYDQPHFIGEFRRFMGMTPTAYLEHRRRFGHGDPSFLPMDEDLLAEALRG